MNKPRGPKELPSSSRGSAGEVPRDAEPFVRLTALAGRRRPTPSASSHEERMGALISRAAVPEGLDAQRLERVWSRLTNRRPGAMTRRTAAMRWAFAATVLLSAGAVLAGTGTWSWPRSMVRRLLIQPGRNENPVPTARRRGDKLARLDELAPRAPSPAAEVEPAPAPPRSAAHPAPRTTARPGAGEPRVAPPPSQPAAEPRDTQLAEESQSLGRALVRLRQSRDAAGALAELDRYAARFPSGILAREALAARVDALLMEGRAADAQAILSRLALGSNERDRELRLIRAELATATACAAALDDYRAVWDAHPDGTWGERALWGQAVCHARLGDDARARADLTSYLAHFPGGPHAADALARLR